MPSSTFWPEDLGQACLLGRVDLGDGPLPVLVRGGRLEDMSRVAPTSAHLLARFPVARAMPAGADIGPADAFEPQAVWSSAGSGRQPRCPR